MNITAKELSGMHVGKRFVLIVPGYDGTQVTGTIYKFTQYRGWIKLTIGTKRTVTIDHDTPITIQEDSK